MLFIYDIFILRIFSIVYVLPNLENVKLDEINNVFIFIVAAFITLD